MYFVHIHCTTLARLYSTVQATQLVTLLRNISPDTTSRGPRFISKPRTAGVDTRGHGRVKAVTEIGVKIRRRKLLMNSTIVL